MSIDMQVLDNIINVALYEDLGEGDITSEALIDEDKKFTFKVINKEPCVICGLKVFERIFKKHAKLDELEFHFIEGEYIKTPQTIISGYGNARDILRLERVSLNFLQHMSGVATTTAEFVKAIGSNKAKLRDTRKTTPLLRYVDKHAVKIGGGENHRMTMSDSILIKDNHLIFYDDIAQAINQAKIYANGEVEVEVECDTLEQVKSAITQNPDMIMLDNMNLEQIKEAMKIINNKVKVEVSGGVNLNSIKEIANLGVDYIAVGAVTHSFKNIDISMDCNL